MWQYSYLEARTINLQPDHHGAKLEVRYRLYRMDGVAIPSRVRVREEIRVLLDTYQIAARFRSGLEDARNGFFNDLYTLSSPEPLPIDFRFEIEQTYTADNVAVTGKNKVVYTPSSVLLYGWEGNRWKIWGRGSGRL